MTIVGAISLLLSLVASMVSDAVPDMALRSDQGAVPVYRCDHLTASKINHTTFWLTVESTAENGAEVESFTFDLGNGTEVTVPEGRIAVDYDSPGIYIVTVRLNVKVGEDWVTVTSGDCREEIEATSPPSAQ